jgi:putative cardiolipin synthase
MLLLLIYLIAFIFASVMGVIVARLIFPPPVVAVRMNSTALPAANSGPLAFAARHCRANQTGVAPLQNGEDAFAARLVLANAAVSSIDAQYYIWRGDLTGYLLLDAVQRAADRGVRVRLLLDDNGTSGLDPQLAALNDHPNIEVRLYNPFNLRRFKALSYAFDFFRLNRRMHNKSFTVDGCATIMGGRNVGDEYFGAGQNAIFVDFDVLAMGAIATEVSADFDRYWAAPSVHRAGHILRRGQSDAPISNALARYSDNPQLTIYRDLAHSSDVAAALAQGDLGLEWTDVVLVSDDPVKGERAVPRQDLLAVRLMNAVGKIEQKFDGISPYLVPTSAGVKAFAKLAAQGVKVRMLTNSLEATDVLAVHAGYTKRRMQMLRAGVGLFELYAQPGVKIRKAKIGPFGSSGSSLHAKTFAVDGERIFIGSFNFDPRSTTLNTEMGLLIKSKTMANSLHTAFDNGLAGLAWQVQKRGRKPIWINHETGDTTRIEPGTGLLRRVAIALIGSLPVEWLL